MWWPLLCGLLLLAQAQDPQRLEITLEKRDAAGWRGVDPRLVLETGDRVRFRLRSNFAGYLYVMNQATSGDYSLLFPREETGRMNRIEAGRDYLVPATDGFFRIAGPPGHEIVYWLMSPVEMAGAALPPPRERQSPARLMPRCDDAVLRARGDCVDPSAGPKPPAHLPQSLAVPGATSRDLVFGREKDASVVTSPASSRGPVVFEFRLAHK